MRKQSLFSLVVILTIGIILALFLYRQKFLGLPIQPAPSGKLEVVASFYPMAFFASQIGGEKALISDITPAGAEPHDYEPTSQDMAKIEKSSLIILNGGGLEAWGNALKQNIDPTRTTLVVAGDGLATEHMEEGGKTIIDPHVWLSPPLAETMVDKIAEGFVTADPTNAEYYRNNAVALKKRLSDLDVTYMKGLADCQRRDIITSHAAFGYLAVAYGLQQVAITGISPDAEPSAQQLAKIVSFAKEQGVKYIFFESLASPKLAETIASEIGAQTLVLNPIEGLTDKELAQGKDYFTEMTTNLTHLETALQCNR